MKRKNILLSSILVSIMVSVSGCNNSDKTNEQLDIQKTDSKIQKISGYVVDGYISNATVCLDINNNNKCDGNEVVSNTDENGFYELDISSITKPEKEIAQVLAFNGFDTINNSKYEGVLKSALIIGEDKINLNPITTLVALNINKNNEYINKLKDISQSLNLNPEQINSDILKLKDKKVYQTGLRFETVYKLLFNSSDLSQYVNDIKKATSNLDGNRVLATDLLNDYDNQFFKTEITNIINNINYSDENIEEIKASQVLLNKKVKMLKKYLKMKGIQSISSSNAPATDLVTLYQKEKQDSLNIDSKSYKQLQELMIKIGLDNPKTNEWLLNKNPKLKELLLPLNATVIDLQNSLESLEVNQEIKDFFNIYINQYLSDNN